MNSESVKELLKWRNSALVCTQGKRRGMWFCFPYFFWGGKFYEFLMTIALAIPPLTVKNREGALIRDRALNRATRYRLCLWYWWWVVISLFMSFRWAGEFIIISSTSISIAVLNVHISCNGDPQVNGQLCTFVCYLYACFILWIPVLYLHGFLTQEVQGRESDDGQ